MITHAAPQQVIDYITAYNNMDVKGMIAALHPDIEFKNRQNGDVTMLLTGLDAFTEQAESALQYFAERKQTITDWKTVEGQTVVWLDYTAVLAIDLPNGMKAGERLDLKGRSIFKLKDNLIIAIEDIS